MGNRLRLACALAAALVVPSAALAATRTEPSPAGAIAWRCGVDQRLYTDEPCAGGHVVELPAARPPGDVAAAQRRVAHEIAQVERQRREREAREAAAIAASSHPVNLGPVRKPLSAHQPRPRPGLRKPVPAQDAAARTWRATAPASRRAAD